MISPDKLVEIYQDEYDRTIKLAWAPIIAKQQSITVEELAARRGILAVYDYGWLNGFERAGSSDG